MNVTNSSFSKNTTVEQILSVGRLIAFDLTQCISGNGEVVMKVLEVGKLRTPSKFFATIHFLAPSFSDKRSSLNFLTVYSCSQNLPLIGCKYA